MATRRTRVLLGLGTPVLVVLLLFAAWAIDVGSSSGEVPRNVKLAGRAIGGLPEDQLATAVRDVATAYANAEVQVRIPGRTYRVRASTLGLMLDEDATIKAALALDDSVAMAVRPLRWLASFAAARPAPLEFTVSDDQLVAGLARLAGPGSLQVTEPRLVDTGSGMGVVSGHNGTAIDAGPVKEQLLRRAASGEQPIVVNTQTVSRDPSVSNTQARAFAALVNLKTARGLIVRTGANQSTMSANLVRSWLGSKVGSRGLELTLDARRAMADLVATLPGPAPARNAQVLVTPPTVTIVPSQDATACCEADSPARLLAAIDAGSPRVDIALQVARPAFTTEAALKLGIREPVGTSVVWNGQPQVKSFTTFFPPGQPEVINIHRIADLVRGALITPGDTFSLNARVGPRIAINGFVPASGVADGLPGAELGGGVSQFAATLFNAAFFAGLGIVSSRAHPAPLPDYPFGREATLGYPGPDLKIKNDTPYAVIIWTTTTADSVTVAMYSTQNVYGEQTAQTTQRSGACDLVTTTRTRRYADGHTSTDAFRAVYPAAPGILCA